MARVAGGPKHEAPSGSFAPRVLNAPRSGPAIVALHGFGGSALAFDRIARALTNVAALWSADGFGHRGVPWPDHVHDFVSGLRAVRALIRDVPAPRYLLGYSMGARIGLSAWAEEPSLFVGATLIGVHPGFDSETERAARRRLDAERSAALRARGIDAFFAAWDRNPLFVGRDTRHMTWRDDHDPEALARALEIWSLGHQPDLRPELGGMCAAHRAQLLVGLGDEKFRRLLAPWRPRTLPGSHDLVTASPDRVARAVQTHRSMLASLGPDGA